MVIALLICGILLFLAIADSIDGLYRRMTMPRDHPDSKKLNISIGIDLTIVAGFFIVYFWVLHSWS
jgi:hypothetical protein